MQRFLFSVVANRPGFAMSAMTMLAGLFVALPLPTVAVGAPVFSFFDPVQPARRIRVMANGSSVDYVPDHTAKALEFSIADSVDWIEIEVRRTADDEHVLFQGDRLERTTSGTGSVRDHGLAELRSFDAGVKFARRFAGSRILTLGEALELARGRINLCIKAEDISVVKLVHEVTSVGMERQVVIRGRTDVLEAIRAADQRMAVLATDGPSGGGLRAIEKLRPAVVELAAADVTTELCLELRRLGIIVEARTTREDDTPEKWARLAGAGVDWIRSDRPEQVVAWQILQAIPARSVKIAHHRGASRYAPENTVAALERAIQFKADFVEFDIQTSQDHALVLLHDRTLDRTTTGHGRARENDAATIDGLDAGAWFGRPFTGTRVPRLEQFLKSVGRRIELYVDAKDIAPEALVAALAQYKLTDRAVVYQSVDYLETLRVLEPSLRRMPSLRDPARLKAIAERVRPYAFDVAWSILSKPLIDECHARGIKVFSDALGVHEKIKEYQQAIRQGIDVIQTDHPVRVLRAIELEHAR